MFWGQNWIFKVWERTRISSRRAWRPAAAGHIVKRDALNSTNTIDCWSRHPSPLQSFWSQYRMHLHSFQSSIIV